MILRIETTMTAVVLGHTVGDQLLLPNAVGLRTAIFCPCSA